MRWSGLKGSLVLDDRAEQEYGSDFGGIVRSRPIAAVRAANVADVVAAVRYARAQGLSVVARGQGHTTRGQAQADGGLVIDLRGLDEIGEPCDATVRVGAGARWSSVVARTQTVGLAPPVLTDYLDLTVGGTLSVGGVGGQSFRHGLQVDNVVELLVVTGAEQILRCSPTENPDLFAACRGGLGYFGVIVEATLRLEPSPRRVRVRRLRYRTLEEFLGAQFVLARSGAFHYLLGNLRPPAEGSGNRTWEFEVECVQDASSDALTAEADARLEPLCASTAVVNASPPVDVGFLDYANRLEAMAAAWRGSGAWAGLHPWLDVFIPHRRAADIIEYALDGLRAPDLGEGFVMTYPLLGEHLNAPLPGTPAADELLLLDILPSVPRDRLDRLAAIELLCRHVLDAVLDAGGTVYPIGYPLGTDAMGPEIWRHHLGVARDALLDTRRRHDPHDICSPGLRMFED